MADSDFWGALQNEFVALGKEEHSAKAAPGVAIARGDYTGHREFGKWSVEQPVTEIFNVRFELHATRGGIELGTPARVRPLDVWLHNLYNYLDSVNSWHRVKVLSSERLLIRNLFIASAMYCAKLGCPRI